MKPSCIVYIATASLILISCRMKEDHHAVAIARQPAIFPDYIGITIPVNIAPLNFCIKETGDLFSVKIESENGEAIFIRQTSPDIRIPENKWHALLQANGGRVLKMHIAARQQGKWQQFDPVMDTIAPDAVDGYLTYRIINTGYIYWRDMQIAQRNLASFDETPVIRNSSVDHACVNCHSFCSNDHTKMSLHFRKLHAGTLIINGPSIKKVNTKTKSSYAAGVYTCWHPGGKLIAYSNNKIKQNFTSFPYKSILVSDDFSDISLYNPETNTVIPCPALATDNRETLPNWSPDGKWLYFVCAPPCDIKKDNSQVRYSLCRIAFDESSLACGKADTLISAERTGKSISFPKASPDGKYILFCMTDYGYFTVFDLHSDLYFYEISTGRYWPLACNSSSMESYHSWSRNGRWIVFASKRMDNMYSRPFFSYVDTAGMVHKPFVMPQSDPAKYMTYLYNYNMPELVDGKVEFSEQKIRDIVLSEAVAASFSVPDSVDAVSGPTWINTKK
jgi:hypothetical protein